MSIQFTAQGFEPPPITTRPGLPLVSLEATAQHGQIRIDKRFVGKI